MYFVSQYNTIKRAYGQAGRLWPEKITSQVKASENGSGQYLGQRYVIGFQGVTFILAFLP